MGTPGGEFGFSKDQQVQIDVIGQQGPEPLSDTVSLALIAFFQYNADVDVALVGRCTPRMRTKKKNGLGLILAGKYIPDDAQGRLNLVLHGYTFSLEISTKV